MKIRKGDVIQILCGVIDDAPQVLVIVCDIKGGECHMFYGDSTIHLDAIGITITMREEYVQASVDGGTSFVVDNVGGEW